MRWTSLFYRLDARLNRREARIKQYHKWFAWYPIRDVLSEQVVWLEVVYRKRSALHGGWVYDSVMPKSGGIK